MQQQLIQVQCSWNTSCCTEDTSCCTEDTSCCTEDTSCCTEDTSCCTEDTSCCTENTSCCTEDTSCCTEAKQNEEHMFETLGIVQLAGLQIFVFFCWNALAIVVLCSAKVSHLVCVWVCSVTCCYSDCNNFPATVVAIDWAEWYERVHVREYMQ